MDTSDLAADVRQVEACLAGPDDTELDACIATPACLDALADANAPARQCYWRQIAAWEDASAAILVKLREALGAEAVNANEAHWQASMLSDVNLATDMLEGGSIQGPVAAMLRAEAQARRGIWLERLRRQLDE